MMLEDKESLDKEFSNKIYWSRLFCAIMVVGIHCKNTEIFSIPDDSWSGAIQQFFCDYIYCFAVPFFFVVSGFFFYYKLNDENFLHRWKKKLKRTLYLYILWNTIYTLYRLIKTNLKVFNGIGRSHNAIQMNLKNIFEGIFLYKYNDGWWFMLQLVILEACLPIIMRKIKNDHFKIKLVWGGGNTCSTIGEL